MQPLGDMLANTWRKVWLSGHQLLSPHVSLATIDYRSVNRFDVDTDVRCVAARAGTAHGLCVWFDTDLVDGIGFSNAPGEQRAIHGQAFFPFATPVALCEGESFEARIQATLVGDDYMWQWSGGGHMQCTLHGVPLGAKQLMKGAATHVPVLNDEGQIDLFVLSRMQQSIPLGEIARELLARFPSAVRDRNTALGRAGDLARRYAKD
jgi:protein arginine N-methyltransferase 1